MRESISEREISKQTKNTLNMSSYKSLLDPQTCGFIRVAAYYICIHKPFFRNNDKENSKVTNSYEHFCEFLTLYDTDADYKIFQKCGGRLKSVMLKWGKQKSKERNIYIETFNPEAWSKLSSSKKEHSWINCKGCEKYYPSIQAKFPVNSKSHIKKAAENLFFKAKHLRINKNVLQDSTREIFNSINKPFEKTFGVSFTESLTSLKEINIVKQPTAVEKKMQKREIVQNMKRGIENDLQTTAVERFVYKYHLHNI